MGVGEVVDLLEEGRDVDVGGRDHFAAGGRLRAGPPPQPEHREHVGRAAGEADDRRAETFRAKSRDRAVEYLEETERVAGERGEAVAGDVGGNDAVAAG